MEETIPISLTEEYAPPVDPNDRRQHIRTDYTYPVEFKIFTQNPVSFKGYLRDISLGGSCLEFDDPYQRVKIKEAERATLKLTLAVPEIEKMSVLGEVRWIKNIENTSIVRLGIELKDVTLSQMDLISKLVGIRNKDHNLLWTLWEEYQSQPS